MGITPIPYAATMLQIPMDPADFPAPPMEFLRTRIGLTSSDTTKDVEIAAAWQMGVSWAEQFLNRYLRAGQYVEAFTHLYRDTISLSAYPLVSVDSILDDDGNAIDAYHIESETGLLHLDGWRKYHMVTVDYTVALPTGAGLQLALLLVFDQVWASTYAATGAASVAAIKATSIDGMRVEYATDASSVSFAESSSGLPPMAASILTAYVRLSA